MLEISEKKLGFGLMRLPLINPNDDSSVDLDLFKSMVDSFIEAGFTYFDTAWMYCGGKSESAVKEALVSRYDRERFTLTDKLAAYVVEEKGCSEDVFNEQLERTAAGYFDYYFLHDVNSRTIRTFDKYNCWDFIMKKKEEGLIRHIGFSFHDGPELLEELLDKHPEIELVQIQLNYLDWESLGIQSRKNYELLEARNLPVLVMEPVKGGTLASLPAEAEAVFKKINPEMSVASWAVRFAASLKNVKVVLSGMSTMEQLEDNIGYMQSFRALDARESEAIDRVSEIIADTIEIPCTGCSYCTVDCPKNIAIPKYFSLYNAEKLERKDKGWTPHPEYYSRLIEEFGSAGECIECGNCESHCPQQLKIRAHLRDVAELFET